MSPEWMEDNVPITVRSWEEEDEALADKQEELKGILAAESRETRTNSTAFLGKSFSLQLFCGHSSFDKHLFCPSLRA